MKKFLITLLLVLSITPVIFAASGTVVLIYDNGTVTYTDTETFYEFDVKAYVDVASGTPVFKYGQIYVEYDTTIFGGQNIVANGNLTSTTLVGPLAAQSGAIDLYAFTNSGNDTYSDAFSIGFEPAYPDNPELYGAETQISINSGSPSTIMHIKMQVAVSGTSTVSWPTNNIVQDQNTLFVEFADGSNYEGLSTTNATETTYITYSNTGDPALPITLRNFEAQYEKSNVTLTWTTESETENLGYVIKRAYQYSDDNLSSYEIIASYQNNENLLGAGTSVEQNEYTFIDKNVKPGVSYKYILEDVDFNGNVTAHDPISILIPENLLVENENFKLGSNFPNPFNPSFTVPFELMTAMDVDIAMYDILGQRIMTIAKGYFEPRQYQFKVNSSNLTSGIYFVRTIIGDQVYTQKMTLLK